MEREHGILDGGTRCHTNTKIRRIESEGNHRTFTTAKDKQS